MEGRVATDFTEAARFLVDVVALVGPDQWTGPGLGEWDVRALTGHAARSLLTVEQYLETPAASVEVPSAVDYLTFVASVDHEAVAERGREAGRGLGDDPVRAVHETAERVIALVEDTPGDTLLAVAGGHGMRFDEYLRTRTFELVVHGIDLARAIGAGVSPPRSPMEATAALAAEAAVRLDRGVELVLALTGRTTPKAGFSIF